MSKAIASMADSNNFIQSGRVGSRGRLHDLGYLQTETETGQGTSTSTVAVFDHLGAERGYNLLGLVFHRYAGMQSVERVERFVSRLGGEHSLRLIRLLLVTLSSQNRPNSK